MWLLVVIARMKFCEWQYQEGVCSCLRILMIRAFGCAFLGLPKALRCMPITMFASCTALHACQTRSSLLFHACSTGSSLLEMWSGRDGRHYQLAA